MKPLTFMDEKWMNFLKEELEKPYFGQLMANLGVMSAQDVSVYPPAQQVFHAFERTALNKVRVIILGQDPYHRQGQAMGLSFSVPSSTRIPPSLKNVFRELQSDLKITLPEHGNLCAWADQGVLLLNAILTVEEGKAGSHRSLGWQQFTDAVIQLLSDQCDHLVFMLWGKFAQSKSKLIDAQRHLILEATHPSPLARGAFSGCRHFSKANAYLHLHMGMEIDWQIPTLQTQFKF